MIFTEPHTEVKEVKRAPINVEEKIHVFRNDIVDAIRNGQEISLPMQLRNGGDFIVRAAFWEVLMRLCNEEQIDPSSVNVTAITTEDSDATNMHEKSMALFSVGMATGRIDKSAARAGTLYQQSLAQFSFSLGVRMTPEDFQQTPRIWPVDKGPLKNYDEEKVAARAAELQQEIGDRPVVVIGQAGSSAEKRFADVQLAEVSSTVHQNNPDAYVIVLSDKPFLRKDVANLPDQIGVGQFVGFPFRERVTQTETYAPEAVQHFRQDLERTLQPEDAFGVDKVVETTDINELLANMRIADEGVFTDSYWMHLAASQGIPKLISLYTLFQPEEWAPPGSISVKANALAGERADHISSKYYHQNPAYTGRRSSYGIENEDMEKLKEVLKRS